MRIAGIIAEFNPFHNGHAYLLEKAREIADADIVVVVLSGSFVQRGAPAIISKYARTKMALCCGADLVAELPVFSSCASAEYFAQGALRLLRDLGADSFVFGSESGSLSELLPLAALLGEEPEEYRRLLRLGLSGGKSFPAARKYAVCALLPHAAPLLDTPNNLLALEYLKACKQRGFNLRPYTVARLGDSYHENELSPHSFPSASALRSLLTEQAPDLLAQHNTLKEQNADSSALLTPWKEQAFNSLAQHNTLKEQTADSPSLPNLQKELTFDSSALLPYMPPAASEILAKEIAQHALVTEADLSTLLACRLVQCPSPEQLSTYADMGTELANRVFARRFESILLPDFAAALKTKELTFTRISRALLHAVLQITGDEQEEFRALPHSPYMRILGMRKTAQPLLARLRKEGGAPLILRPAKAKKLLPPQAYQFFMKDIAAAELYRQLSFAHSRRSSACEFTHEIIRCE